MEVGINTTVNVATDDLGSPPTYPRCYRSAWRSLHTSRSRLAAACAVLASLLGSLLAGCGNDVRPADPPTPAAAVTNYYRALQYHHLSQAASYVAPPARGSVTSENGNFLAITRLRVTPAKIMPLSLMGQLPVSASGYSSFVQVVAYFDATLRQIIDTPNGPQAWFLYLGKSRNKSIGWQILSVGSGP
jgi:hypothetical protein